MTDELTKRIEEAKEACVSLLHECVSPWGLMASGDRGGYHNLWSRDSMITALGILETKDETLHEAVLRSLLSLRDHQTELGLIPNKIDFGENKRVNFRAYADGGLWFTLIVARFLRHYPNHPESYSLINSAKLALSYTRHQDHDQSGLVSIDEGSTWMDLFPLRGKSLYVNVLRYWATSELAYCLGGFGNSQSARELELEAIKIKEAINGKLWYEPGKDVAKIIQDSFSTSSYDENGIDALGRHLLLPQKNILTEESYYLPYLTLRHFGEWFDSLGNILAIISGVADRERSKKKY